MSIALDPKDLERAKRLLKGIPGGAHKAVARALNRTAQTTRTALSRKVTERYTVKAGDVKSSMKMTRAGKELEARIDIESPRIDASKFKLKPRQDTTGQPNKKVTAEYLKGSPFQVKKGFIWHGHLFEREEEKRLPINKMTGPAIAQMAGSEQVIEEVEERASDALSRNLEHEVTVLLEGWDKKK
ncbi:MAG: phage tail protein [Succinivibrio sp.]|nr:phage tail protein [Succinivibrio sp.]